MASSLIRGKYVIVKVTSRTEAQVIADGAVFQRDGAIVEIGPFADLIARHRPDEVLGSPDHVVVPGFVNGHHHVGLTPFQLGSPDYPLELWFASRMAARTVDPYLDTLYSAFEMLESGITTVQHLHGVRLGPAARVIAAAERVLKAYDDIGMRVSYSYALRDQNRLAYENDDAFASRSGSSALFSGRRGRFRSLCLAIPTPETDSWSSTIRRENTDEAVCKFSFSRLRERPTRSAAGAN